jgi:hypothetical protein
MQFMQLEIFHIKTKSMENNLFYRFSNDIKPIIKYFIGGLTN